jgi:hypothetical protein
MGYSIYLPKKLDMLFNDCKLDTVQVLYNFLDRGIGISRWLKKLHKKKLKFR